jgi:VIT1/CCC1 family predicted Fe2+/Mn2+ transporter
VSVRLADAPLGSRDNGKTTRLAEVPPTEQLKSSLRRLLAALLERGFGIVLESVERLAGTFDEIAARGGVKVGALWGGARAGLSGRNPVWGAVKGAFSALSAPARAALIIALVLALLALAIIAVVKARSAGA